MAISRLVRLLVCIASAFGLVLATAGVASAIIRPVIGTGTLEQVRTDDTVTVRRTVHTIITPGSVAERESFRVRTTDTTTATPTDQSGGCVETVSQDQTTAMTTWFLAQVGLNETAWNTSFLPAERQIAVSGTLRTLQAFRCTPLKHTELQYTLEYTVAAEETDRIGPGCYQPLTVNWTFLHPDDTDGEAALVQIGDAACLTVSTLEVIKELVPSVDPGRFDLLIDDVVQKPAAGDGDGSGPVTVAPGSHVVSEQVALASDVLLTDYVTSISCVDKDDDFRELSSGTGTSLVVDVPAGHDVQCRFTNEKPGVLVVTAGYGYSVAALPQSAGAAGQDFVFITGDANALSRVEKVCIRTTWSAMDELRIATTKPMEWNGDTGPFEDPLVTLVSRSKPEVIDGVPFWDRRYRETISYKDCRSGTTATFDPLPWGGAFLLVTQPGAVFLTIDHTLTAEVYLTGGGVLTVTVPGSAASLKKPRLWDELCVETYLGLTQLSRLCD